MPNWCWTRISILHNDIEKVNSLDALLDKWTSKDYMDNGFGHGWLGNIVLGSGIGTVDTGKETDLRCRGTLIEHWIEDGMLIIGAETAWNPMLRMWVKLIEKYLPGAELIYEADECGNGVQCTNDPDLIDKYIMDYYGNDEDIESDWEASEETVRKTLQKMLGTTETNIEKLTQMAWDEDLEISIRKWDFIDVDEVVSWEA